MTSCCWSSRRRCAAPLSSRASRSGPAPAGGLSGRRRIPPAAVAGLAHSDRAVRDSAGRGVGAGPSGVWLPELLHGCDERPLRTAPMVNADELLGLVMAQPRAGGSRLRRAGRARPCRVRAPGWARPAQRSPRLAAPGLARRGQPPDRAAQGVTGARGLGRGCRAASNRARPARRGAAAARRAVREPAPRSRSWPALNRPRCTGYSSSSAATLKWPWRSSANSPTASIPLYSPIAAWPRLSPSSRRAPPSHAARTRGSGRYPPQVEATVYFCCLEALQNAGKHAGDAASATIRVREEEGGLLFEVADDGAGFNPAAEDAEPG